MMNRTIKIPITTATQQDEEGYPVKTTTYRENIPADMRSAQRSDQILADQKGYSADVVVHVMVRNLTGLPTNWSQFIDELSGDVYEVKRTYREDKSRTVELTGQLVRRGATP